MRSPPAFAHFAGLGLQESRKRKTSINQKHPWRSRHWGRALFTVLIMPQHHNFPKSVLAGDGVFLGLYNCG
jgi:hypothetical protein